MQQDISVLNKHKQKKLSLSSQRKVIELFSNLFANGFHLAEIIDFLTRSKLIPSLYTDVMERGLLAGKSFSEILADLHFSDSIVTQLSLSEIHGNTVLSLEHIQHYLANLATVKKKFIEVATYPVLLLLFLLAIMLGLRYYLLPQMQYNNLATHAIQHLPSLFLILLLAISLFLIGFRIWYKKTNKITVFTRLAQIPFIGILIKTYLTAYYAREWGSLISQGLELSQILEIMQTQSSQLFRELGQDLTLALSNGGTFNDQIAHYPFFKKELSLIIEYGQIKSKLGHELDVYAAECWEEFFSKINTCMQLIQPFIFLCVALMIILIYAAMLLPLYNTMEIPI